MMRPIRKREMKWKKTIIPLCASKHFENENTEDVAKPKFVCNAAIRNGKNGKNNQISDT